MAANDVLADARSVELLRLVAAATLERGELGRLGSGGGNE